MVIKGRGTALLPANRFAAAHIEADEPQLPSIATQLRPDKARSVITRNRSPDIPFDQSINPYQGCEHGCIYCYARPSHAYYGLSAGLDFETQIFFKANAAELLRKELSRPGYQCKSIMLGANTDPWQPVERKLGITRGILTELLACRHPVSVITKGVAIERDIDLLAELASRGLCSAFISLPTLNPKLKRVLEPRAASAQSRLRIIEALAKAGVPVGVMVAPVIPVLTDHELEAILTAAKDAGAQRVAYVMLRLPFEVNDLFRDWLQTHYPDTAEHVMSRVRDLRGGHDNDPRFGLRMSGQGAWARLFKQRFELSCRKLALQSGKGTPLDTSQFRPPVAPTAQLTLF